MEDKFRSVSAVVEDIKTTLQANTNLKEAFVKGEVSDYRLTGKSINFSLVEKNEDGKKYLLPVVIWDRVFPNIKFEIKNGIKVKVKGTISTFNMAGQYQLTVESIVKDDGLGELLKKYIETYKELSAMHVFDKPKKSIPKYPKRIGVVTSESGAVIVDIRKKVKERYPLAEIVLYHSLVQGDNAIQSIVSQIDKANKENKVDVLIVGRGGGSDEDLRVYNEKEVALAVYRSNLPIIASIGHGINKSICDEIADFSVVTPTAAAELATPSMDDEIIPNLNNLLFSSKSHFKSIIDMKMNKILELEKRLEARSPKNKIELLISKYEWSKEYLPKNINNVIKDKIDLVADYNEERILKFKQIYDYKKNKLEHIEATLKNLDPFSIMDRGYSIVSKGELIIRSINDVKKGDSIEITLKDGNIKAKVE